VTVPSLAFDIENIHEAQGVEYVIKIQISAFGEEGQ
jgi:hypothetical protein